MVGRYELSDQRWQMIEDIVSPPQTMGRPRRDDRQMLNGIFWILSVLGSAMARSARTLRPLEDRLPAFSPVAR